MELSSVNLARSIWLFDTQELNPRGLSVVPDLHANLVSRYRFTAHPKLEELETNRRFAKGTFVLDGQPIETSLEIHGDGLVADTRHSTEASNAFLSDFVDWLADQFKLTYPPDLVRKTTYRSELIVFARGGLRGISPALEPFIATLSQVTSEPQEPSAIFFGSQDRHPIFTFERRVGAPFSENRFFSAAALETSRHLELLNRLEQLLLLSQ